MNHPQLYYQPSTDFYSEGWKCCVDGGPKEAFEKCVDKVRIAVAAEITAATGESIICDNSAWSTYLWCTTKCGTDWRNGFGGYWACTGACVVVLNSNRQGCINRLAYRIHWAWIEGDAQLDWCIYQYSGCN
ncbi:MAG: hypothetical protein M2R45_02771 [Verrucomicrobia subdivision 3 bacterium]|nr:hypothetical protein [Limisphaerales bacterium]MCS1414320.1 hypothetical protein [Limisphaerales bacterium]